MRGVQLLQIVQIERAARASRHLTQVPEGADVHLHPLPLDPNRLGSQRLERRDGVALLKDVELAVHGRDLEATAGLKSRRVGRLVGKVVCVYADLATFQAYD